MSTAIRDFINFLHKSGHAPYVEGEIKDTGGESVLIRAADDKQGRKTLYYSFIHESEGKAFGHYYSCKAGEGDYWYAKAGRDWTPGEKQEWKERQAAIRLEQEKAKAIQYGIVAKECSTRYKALGAATNEHLYAVTKGIKLPSKVRQDGDDLVIPAIDMAGAICTLQTISPDGEKRFTWQGRKDGAYFPIQYKRGADPERIYFCEGFATGCTVHEATGHTVIVCFDAGNIAKVMAGFRARHPYTPFIIAADNDQWTLRSPRAKSLVDIVSADVAGDDPRWAEWRIQGFTYNTGMDKAGQAGAEFNARVVQPIIPDDDKDKRTDYNDMGVAYTKNRLLDVGLTLSPNALAAPTVVEAMVSPDTYAPAVGDEIVNGSYDAVEIMYAFQPPPMAAKRRSDGNPEWFTHMIWDKEPVGKLASVKEIKDLHNGKSLSNLMTFTRGNYPGMFVLDEFRDDIIVRCRPPWLSKDEPFRIHTLTDSDVVNYTAIIERYGFNIGKDRVRDVIVSVSEKDQIHPVRAFFSGKDSNGVPWLQWDGQPRLDTWLVDYAGATTQDRNYVQAIGAKWLIAAVARIFQPGCKFDHMLVLEGKTDIGKSALLREIATFGHEIEESYFTDSISMKQFDNQFAAKLWQGHLVVEFAELDGMDKSNVNTVKAWITRQEDVYMPKFSNDRKHRPRQFVLSGSTNEDTWLIDTTGNKRFWPVRCERIDIPGLKAAKEQLWAEAVHRYHSGEQWWLSDDDPIYTLARAEQATRITGDSWGEVIESRLMGKSLLSMKDVYEMLGLHVDRQNRDTDMRIRGIMKMAGYSWKQAYAVTGDKRCVWVKD